MYLCANIPIKKTFYSFVYPVTTGVLTKSGRGMIVGVLSWRHKSRRLSINENNVVSNVLQRCLLCFALYFESRCRKAQLCVGAALAAPSSLWPVTGEKVNPASRGLLCLSVCLLATWSTNITNAHKVAISRKWAELPEAEPCFTVKSVRLRRPSAAVVICERSLQHVAITYSPLMYSISWRS